MPALNGFIGLGNHLTDGILVEPLASKGYARAAVAVDAFQSGVGVNNALLSWGPATADWGTMQYGALYDASGNQIFAAALDAPVVVTAAGANQVQCLAGTLAIRLGPDWALDLVLDDNGQIVTLESGEPAQTP